MDKPLFINSTKEYEEKLKEVERLVALDPELASIDGIRLGFLASQVEMYEKLHFDFGAKLAKARRIREEIFEYFKSNFTGLIYPHVLKNKTKCAVTKIIMKMPSKE